MTAQIAVDFEMEQTGRVIAVDGKNATVQIKRLSACESCHKAESGCAVCSLLSGNSSSHTSRVKNPIGAAVGDRVLLVADDSKILIYSALVFVLPIIVAAASYAIAAALGGELFVCVIATAISFASVFVALYFSLNRREAQNPGIRIERILEDSDATECELSDTEE